jgi:CRP-like cAMP-binding protein
MGPTVPSNVANTDWLEALLPEGAARHLETHLPAGTIIHRFGSPSRGIFFVKAGTIEISLPSPDGGANTIFLVGPGGAVGLTSALFDHPSETNATVLIPVTGYYIPVSIVREWLARDPALYLPLAQMLSEWNESAVRVLRNGRMQPSTASERRLRPSVAKRRHI